MKVLVKRPHSLSTGLLSFFTLLTALTFYFLISAEILSQKVGFTLLTLLLSVFLTLEINYVRITHKNRWLMNPAVLCSIMTFYLYFVFSNILYYLPEHAIATESLSGNITLAMNKMMLMVIMGAIALWLGYWSNLSKRLLNFRLLIRIRNANFNDDKPPKAWVIPAFYLIANISRLIQVSFGIFGYSTTYEQLLDAASYTQYLTLTDNLGTLALLIVS